MAQLTIGLDLGNESLKRVRLKSSFRAVEVIDYTRVELAQDERPLSERLAEAMEQLGGESGASALVATALPGNVVSVRTLQLPFTDAKRINQTAGFELESQLPFSLNAVVYDILRIAKTPEGVRLLAAVCQLEQMERWLQTFQTAGVDPRLVGADCLAYSSLAEYLPQPEEEQDRVAVLDIGHKLTSVCILGPGGVEFGRTLSGGGKDATIRLAEAFKMSPEEAEAGKRREGFVESELHPAASPEQVLVSDAIRKATDTQVRELRQTLSSHRAVAGARVGKIWLCGGGASLTNLDVLLAEELDVEVEQLGPEHLEIDGIHKLGEGLEHDGAVTWAKALGLALHAHQGGRQGFINLRRGPFAFKGDFTAMRGKLLQVAASLVILAILAVGSALVSYFSLRSTVNALDARVRETTQAILGKPYDSIDKALGIINEKMSDEADPLPRFTALNSLFEIHERVPEELEIRLRDISVSPKRIRIEGFTDTFDSVEKVKSAMEKNKCFTDIKTGRTRKTKDETEVEFELTIANGC